MTPRATLRLQLHAGFTFDDAAAHVDYFARIGVSHLYLSPITTAEPGSRHGYDTVDYTAISAERGGEDGFVRLVDALRAHRMGVIVDIVPNHMGVGGSSNRWWNDVLEWGPASPYARYFDIDWHPGDAALDGKVLLPCLALPYGDALAAGDIALRVDAPAGRFAIDCAGRRLPVAVATYPEILRAANRADLTALAGHFDQAAGLAPDSARVAAAHAALRDFVAARGPHALDAALRAFDPARAGARLHPLLERQHYRLAWWRTAADEINWRRFFDIATLAGLRVDDETVFDAVHALLFRLYAAGLVDGVRVDHVDGLADPRGYCRRLRARLAALRAEPPYLVVEKILAPREALRDDWTADGTTGYDFMNDVAALLHDPAGGAPLAAHWASVSGAAATFAQEALAGKRQVLATALAREHGRVADALHGVARASLRTRDISRIAIHRVLGELAIRLPAYRLYPAQGDAGSVDSVDPVDQRHLDDAYHGACAAIADADRVALDHVAGWLGLRGVGARGSDAALPSIRVAFAQLTAPLAAKGVEDTAHYRYGRLLSRNEVGADAGEFSLSRGAFHARNRRRARATPHTLVATATHDHKRGEDARARLAVLSEAPDAWRAASLAWSAFNAPHRRPAHRGLPWVPGPGAEAMLYQTLVGGWPPGLAPDDAHGLAALAERVGQWQTKALREAKRDTGWLAPDAQYERGCAAFLRALLAPRGDDDFAHRLQAFVARIAPAGVVNSLSQAALRIASPGVPDLYQGTEAWDHSLVDPDNRRDVPFAALAAERVDEPVASYLRTWPDARVKRALVERMLGLRARWPATFAAGHYLPLRVRGSEARHAIAFARRDADATIVVVATRLAYALLDGVAALPRIAPQRWRDTAVELPPDMAGPWFDWLNDRHGIAAPDGRLRLDACLAELPVAVLTAAGGAPVSATT
ncbi:maltooligosyl trehalose synthase [Burkholderia stagnalis]|uniref:malto-oligosyltrehalose synthase n=1 Tax=Burkholderia stagnalis TaxID=1503054 RepID=UPI00075FA753|nr:malto-oligosyltrehalose synthase [Burkholderia stagnalis]KWK24713.1 maltooligosyl trehalose synthase [Burkholderia stagnalis]